MRRWALGTQTEARPGGRGRLDGSREEFERGQPRDTANDNTLKAIFVDMTEFGVESEHRTVLLGRDRGVDSLVSDMNLDDEREKERLMA